MKEKAVDLYVLVWSLPRQWWFAVLCWFWLQCSHGLRQTQLNALFANPKIVDESGTQTPGCLMTKPFFTRFIGFLFHITIV
jgi:hypothetical protein